MDKLIEAFNQFIPVFAKYPKWMQFFFFAVVLQFLVLSFLMLVYYISEQTASNKALPQNRQMPSSSLPSQTGIGEDIDGMQTTPDKTSRPNSQASPTSPRTATSPRANVSSNATNPDPISAPSNTEEFEGSSDPNVALSLANLATLSQAQGNYRKAEETWNRVLAIQERAFGRTHPAYAASLQNLATLLVEMGRYQDAITHQEEAINIFEQVFGSNHPNTATALNHLAGIYLKLARYQDAAPLVERALEIRRSALGPDHPDIIPVLENLLVIYRNAGNAAKVDEITNEITRLREQFGLPQENDSS